MKLKVGDKVIFKNTLYTIRKIDNYSIYLIDENDHRIGVQKTLFALLKPVA